MDKMVFASQSNPIYFADANLEWDNEKKKGNKGSFFGGNLVAISPAMYAVY